MVAHAEHDRAADHGQPEQGRAGAAPRVFFQGLMAEHQDEDQGAGEKGRDFIAAGDGHGPGDQEGQAEAGRGPEQRMGAVGIPEPGSCEFFRQEDHDAAQKHKQRGPGEPVAFPDPVRDAHPYVPDGQDHDIADRGRESPGNGFSACEEKERRQAGGSQFCVM